MGFFSGIRRRIKKLIPKEIRPFVPYAAALLPGSALGLGAFAKANPSMYKALMAGGTKFLSDEDADLKDVATYEVTPNFTYTNAADTDVLAYFDADSSSTGTAVITISYA